MKRRLEYCPQPSLHGINVEVQVEALPVSHLLTADEAVDVAAFLDDATMPKSWLQPLKTEPPPRCLALAREWPTPQRLLPSVGPYQPRKRPTRQSMRPLFVQLARIGDAMHRERKQSLTREKEVSSQRVEALALLTLCRWKAFGSAARQQRRLAALHERFGTSHPPTLVRHLLESPLGRKAWHDYAVASRSAAELAAANMSAEINCRHTRSPWQRVVIGLRRARAIVLRNWALALEGLEACDNFDESGHISSTGSSLVELKRAVDAVAVAAAWAEAKGPSLVQLIQAAISSHRAAGASAAMPVKDSESSAQLSTSNMISSVPSATLSSESRGSTASFEQRVSETRAALSHARDSASLARSARAELRSRVVKAQGTRKKAKKVPLKLSEELAEAEAVAEAANHKLKEAKRAMRAPLLELAGPATLQQKQQHSPPPLAEANFMSATDALASCVPNDRAGIEALRQALAQKLAAVGWWGVARSGSAFHRWARSLIKDNSSTVLASRTVVEDARSLAALEDEIEAEAAVVHLAPGIAGLNDTPVSITSATPEDLPSGSVPPSRFEHVVGAASVLSLQVQALTIEHQRLRARRVLLWQWGCSLAVVHAQRVSRSSQARRVRVWPSLQRLLIHSAPFAATLDLQRLGRGYLVRKLWGLSAELPVLRWPRGGTTGLAQAAASARGFPSEAAAGLFPAPRAEISGTYGTRQQRGLIMEITKPALATTFLGASAGSSSSSPLRSRQRARNAARRGRRGAMVEVVVSRGGRITAAGPTRREQVEVSSCLALPGLDAHAPLLACHGSLAVSLSTHRALSGPRQRLAALGFLAAAVEVQAGWRRALAGRLIGRLRYQRHARAAHRVQQQWRLFLARRRLRELARERAPPFPGDTADPRLVEVYIDAHGHPRSRPRVLRPGEGIDVFGDAVSEELRAFSHLRVALRSRGPAPLQKARDKFARLVHRLLARAGAAVEIQKLVRGHLGRLRGLEARIVHEDKAGMAERAALRIVRRAATKANRQRAIELKAKEAEDLAASLHEKEVRVAERAANKRAARNQALEKRRRERVAAAAIDKRDIAELLHGGKGALGGGGRRVRGVVQSGAHQSMRSRSSSSRSSSRSSNSSRGSWGNNDDDEDHVACGEGSGEGSVFRLPPLSPLTGRGSIRRGSLRAQSAGLPVSAGVKTTTTMALRHDDQNGDRSDGSVQNSGLVDGASPEKRAGLTSAPTSTPLSPSSTLSPVRRHSRHHHHSNSPAEPPSPHSAHSTHRRRSSSHRRRSSHAEPMSPTSPKSPGSASSHSSGHSSHHHHHRRSSHHHHHDGQHQGHSSHSRDRRHSSHRSGRSDSSHHHEEEGEEEGEEIEVPLPLELPPPMYHFKEGPLHRHTDTPLCDPETGEVLELQHMASWTEATPTSMVTPHQAREARAIAAKASHEEAVAAAAKAADDARAAAVLAQQRADRLAARRARRLAKLEPIVPPLTDHEVAQMTPGQLSRVLVERKYTAHRKAMSKMLEARGDDHEKVLIAKHRLTSQVFELSELRDKHQAHLMTLVALEHKEEARRAREARKAAVHSDAAAWVAVRHSRERKAAELTITRVKHDNEIALIARMKKHGLAL